MNEKTDQYLVAILDKSSNADSFLGQIMYVIAPSNKALASMLDLLNPETHVIASITPLGNVEDFKDFMSRLSKTTRPEDLNFGEIDS